MISKSLRAVFRFNVRTQIVLRLLAASLVSMAVVHDVAYGVPRETQEEKAANLQQQAKGGLFQRWTFDGDQLGALPAGFVTHRSSQDPLAEWIVQPDGSAPSLPNVMRGASGCQACYQLLVAEGLAYEYPDLSIRFRQSPDAAGVGGLVLGAQGSRSFYAAIVDLRAATVRVIRMADGQETLLSQGKVDLKPVEWHALRVQRNTIISKDFLEVFVDGTLILSVEDQTLGLGQVGLVLAGPSSLWFDSFHAVPLFSHRPLSKPPAY